MTISEEIDIMIDDLKNRKVKPEYIIMGRNICTRWLVEMTSGTDFELHTVKKYNFKHQGVPVIVCQSEILEVVPNARFLLDGTVT